MDNARARFFFGNAWRSIASTRNLFGKLCLLALIQFVPILGQIVALGYMLGWAREAAWNMETPLPAHVFGRDDDSFWARGALAFVITVLYGLIGSAIGGVIMGAYGAAVGGLNLGGAAYVVVTVVFVVIELLVALWLAALEAIGLVRMAIYNSFGAAFQWGVACRMIGREFGGLFKLFWTMVLALLILGILGSIAIAALVPAFVGVGIGAPLAATVASYGDITESSLALLGSVLGATGLLSVTTAVVTFLVAIPTLMVEALLWRAFGSWVALFDVASWGGRHEGLPSIASTVPTSAEDGSLAMGVEVPQPQRQSHPVLVGLGSLLLAFVVGAVCSGCVAAMAASLYNSGAVQIDASEAAQALREAADEVLYEWESIWY